MDNLGSNKVSDMYNNCINKSTFEFRRYGNGEHTQRWIDNPLFNGDISKETGDLNNMYFNLISDKSDNIYISIIEDMQALGYNPNNIEEIEEIDKNINNRTINNLRKS